MLWSLNFHQSYANILSPYQHSQQRELCDIRELQKSIIIFFFAFSFPQNTAYSRFENWFGNCVCCHDPFFPCKTEIMNPKRHEKGNDVKCCRIASSVFSLWWLKQRDSWQYICFASRAECHGARRGAAESKEKHCTEETGKLREREIATFNFLPRDKAIAPLRFTRPSLMSRFSRFGLEVRQPQLLAIHLTCDSFP